MDLPTVGYAGHQSLYKDPVTNIQHRKDPFFNVNPMRPRLNIKDVRSTDEYKNLSTGYQLAMNSTKKVSDVKAQDVNIPVVGYSGHTMCNKS
jgi:hypothetical protein